jgi:YVTN family beta-propeller protein
VPLYKQIGAFQRRGAVNRRLRSPFARSDADLPLLKPVEEAILTSKPSSIRRMLVLTPRALSQSAFITSQNSNTVWVIDTVTTTVVVTIPVLSNSYGVAFNPNGRRVYQWSFP